MNTQQTLDQFKSLKLKGMAQAYEAIVALPVHEQLTLHQLAAKLAEAETLHRANQKTQLFLRLSKLRYNALLENVHCSDERNFNKDQCMTLYDCSFIKRAENILITGSTGCGKSYLACAIGRQACSMGYKVLYVGMTRFIDKINLSKLDGTFVKWLNHLQKHHLIILDDFGLQPVNENTRLTLLQLLEDRYGTKSVMITSQLPLNKWYEYLDEPTLADAIMDRLAARAHKIELRGESKRKSTINLLS
ncbi:MAG: ATP-binding protein [Ignavibacteria bacterium]|nr:ATP-binding protein [Ignavibacteria bacterium]